MVRRLAQSRSRILATASNEQKALLKELSMNPIWGSILLELDAMRAIPRYRPGPEKAAEEKTQEWVYRSGIDAGIEKALLFLGYER